MGELEQISFQIISSVGVAKSCFIEAIKAAKQQDKENVEAKMKEGEIALNEGHRIHFELIQKEAQGDHVPFQLLFMHAEDQMMAAETIHIIAQEFIELYLK